MSVTLEITTLTHGGDGLGHLDGKAVFVSGTVPGDHVRCRLVVEKKRYAKGQLLEVLTPSPMRIKPPCNHFDDCGGCDWQQLSYADQCNWKERLFRENCLHQLSPDPAVIKPLLVSPQPLGYRSRVQFKCRTTSSGFKLGFYRRGSHTVVDLISCHVVDPKINILMPQLRQLFDDSPYANQIQQIDVAVGDSGSPRVIVHINSGQVGNFCEWLAEHVDYLPVALFVRGDRCARLQQIKGERDVYLEVDDPAIMLAYAPGGFAQINLQQNRVLVELVKRSAAVGVDDTVLDLYCGMGNFALPLAGLAKRVIGVEGYVPSIELAKSNAAKNGIENSAFYAESVEKFILSVQEQVDVVILDPPRAGAKEAVLPLMKLQPRRIVYVSCDQHTLMRDLKVLLEGCYQLRSIQPIDMFPQTAHTEVLAVLDRV
ncbi:MAG: 23S rRNA (uracil(1939)-C(5))-methyltransferase RlmD [Thermodesulfobacteriota bacterium]|nr:23S rRNA (uracil(1939)-C(5))-methyltransferase RlmD [Thermodesulfobacteriota bacterium]